GNQKSHAYEDNLVPRVEFATCENDPRQRRYRINHGSDLKEECMPVSILWPYPRHLETGLKKVAKHREPVKVDRGQHGEVGDNEGQQIQRNNSRGSQGPLNHAPSVAESSSENVTPSSHRTESTEANCDAVCRFVVNSYKIVELGLWNEKLEK